MSRVRVSSVSMETMVSPPWASSKAFGGRKRATTLMAELAIVRIMYMGEGEPHDNQSGGM
jgi:hypothetical protein